MKFGCDCKSRNGALLKRSRAKPARRKAEYIYSLTVSCIWMFIVFVKKMFIYNYQASFLLTYPNLPNIVMLSISLPQFCPYNRKNITRRHEDINLNILSISSRHRNILYLYHSAKARWTLTEPFLRVCIKKIAVNVPD